MNTQRAILLIRRPIGMLTDDDFGTSIVPVASPGDDQVLIRVKLLSIDPYLRTIMDEAPLVGRSLPLGSVIPGRGIGEIIQSRAAQWKPGQLVSGEFGWQEMACVDANALRNVSSSVHPPSWHLGVLGMPGATALIALELIGRPKENESILVTSAAGTVGSAVGQIAKALGCRTFGTAGPEKLEICVKTFGFDHCFDRHSSQGVREELAAVTDGIDILFDNVGDEWLTSALSMMKPDGRVILCGRLAHYDRPKEVRESDQAFKTILLGRLCVQGFNIRDHAARFEAAFQKLVALADRGLLKQIDSACRGLEGAPGALRDLLAGRHVGKVVVEI